MTTTTTTVMPCKMTARRLKKISIEIDSATDTSNILWMRSLQARYESLGGVD